MNSVRPNSAFIRKLVGEEVPITDRLDEPADFLPNRIPGLSASAPASYHFQEQLKEIKLPASYFLSNKDGTPDTALSETGLSTLMTYYARCRRLQRGNVYMDDKSFVNDLESIKKDLMEHKIPIASLVCFEKSKRHVTAFYFTIENENPIVYVFDSTGISLPAHPCGHHGYSNRGLINYSEIYALHSLSEIGIGVAIMPINITASIQTDRISCLMSAVCFFEAMCDGHYESVENMGLAECWGVNPLIKTDDKFTLFVGGYNPIISKLFVINYLPLLIGCQNGGLDLILMIDPLKNGDALFPIIIQHQADWHRTIYSFAGRPFTKNIFWQAAYLRLLDCLSKANTQNEIPLPDLTTLATSSSSIRRISPFEKWINPVRHPNRGIVMGCLLTGGTSGYLASTTYATSIATGIMSANIFIGLCTTAGAGLVLLIAYLIVNRYHANRNGFFAATSSHRHTLDSHAAPINAYHPERSALSLSRT